MLSPKQKEWLCQDHKKAKVNGQDIPAVKTRWGQPPPKPIKHLESAIAVEKQQFSSLTAQKEKMIAALIDPDSAIKVLDKGFPLKPDSVGAPDIYLGAKLKPYSLRMVSGHGVSVHPSTSERWSRTVKITYLKFTTTAQVTKVGT